MSADAVTVNVAVVAPDSNVTVPERLSVSPAPALSTVSPFVLPATLYVNVVLAVAAAFAVIV